MDKDRQIRFLYPPLFFLAFLWWAYNPQPLQIIQDYLKATKESHVGMEQIVGIIASGGAVILVLGFLIGTVSAVLLRLFFWFGDNSYETVLSKEALERLWPEFLFKKDKDHKFEPHTRWSLYAGATLDHSMLPQGIHEWLRRRWNAFTISINSCVSLMAVVIIVVSSGCQLQPSGIWWMTTFGATVFLLINGCAAWKDTMTMLEFQSHRQINRLCSKQTSADSGNGNSEKSTDASDETE